MISRTAFCSAHAAAIFFSHRADAVDVVRLSGGAR